MLDGWILSRGSQDYLRPVPRPAEVTVGSSSVSSTTGRRIGLTLGRGSGENSVGSELISITEAPLKQPQLFALLENWNQEYGDRADSDLSTQIADLEQSPITFRQM